ncbi:hypothetical protein JB92DRAFT_1599467 [Gautieria morchelliformis]|nr:hypothetical protein JB92DRAFT_1599467 [Gautieria morchelliformis]
MADFRSHFTLRLLNILAFLWFTAVNGFAFALSLGLVGRSEPSDPGYGSGINKETYLKPEPWIDLVLLLMNILFVGTVFAQWTDKGRDIAVGALSFRWPLLMVSSTLWIGAWLKKSYIASWICSLVVAVLADHTNRIVRRRYRLEYELNFKDELFIYAPFSVFHGWAICVFAANSFATFFPTSAAAGLASKMIAVWALAALSGVAHLAAFSTRSGDIPLSLTVALWQYSIFVHQIHGHNTNSRHLVAWFAFGFSIVTVGAVAKSVWGTVDVIRHGAGAVRLDDEEERDSN